MLQEYDIVKVVKLKKADRRYDGSPGVMRAPQIGDIGAVVHTHPEAPLVVECLHGDGSTIWLADFDYDELELISRP